MVREVRLRDSRVGSSNYPWVLGDILDDVLMKIGARFVHVFASGYTDISGNQFAQIFADSADGHHLQSPLGIADVVVKNVAWSVKTVKNGKPFQASTVRLISGRNSPDYSLGISDPRRDAARTGDAVLAIWNARVSQAASQYQDLRTIVLVRNMDKKQFCLFETATTPFPTGDYEWKFNTRNNLEGYDKVRGDHFFTWQPHGSQFTIIRPVPGSSRQFGIPRDVPSLGLEFVLKAVHFEKNWIVISN